MSLPSNYHRVAVVAEALSTIKIPALSTYELAKLLFQLGLFAESQSPKTDYNDLLKTILELHLLSASSVANVYLLFGRTSTPPAEIACSIDHFAYVSHLSAMEHHGITDRFSKVLYMTRPSASTWKQQAKERMEKDLGEELGHYLKLELPPLKRHNLDKINKTPIHFEERSQLGAFRNVSDSTLRVATIGRVFLDMIREPELCGGIQHILDVYKKEAHRYLKFIVDEIDRHGKAIDKVRAGYILEEVCKLSHPILEQWVSFAQRGGSRKLNPKEEYTHTHSERWELSINVPSLMLNSDLDEP